MQINVRSSQEPKKFGRGKKGTSSKKEKLKGKGATVEESEVPSVETEAPVQPPVETVETANAASTLVSSDVSTDTVSEEGAAAEQTAPKKGGLSFKVKQPRKARVKTAESVEASTPVEAELIDEEAILDDLNDRPAASLTLSFILFFIGGLVVAGILGWFSSDFLAKLLVTLGVIA